MKDIFSMWKYTKMVSLVSLSAALYAALLIPFKSIQLFPGVDIRIATVMVPVAGILFGPAGAWGCAIGNLVSDFFGTMGTGSIFGFWGNFFFAYATYKIWYSGKDNYPEVHSFKKIIKYIISCIGGTAAITAIIMWGLSALLGFVPYKVLGPIIVANNSIVPLALGVPLLMVITRRLDRWGLLFTSIMKPEDFRQTRTELVGNVIFWVCSIGSFILSMYLSITKGMDTGMTLTLINLPFIILTLVGLGLMGISRNDFDREKQTKTGSTKTNNADSN